MLITSKQLGLEVIPLVQTFGHMEFILKHGQFASLRDSPQMPESICPCHEQTMNLIGLYIDQVCTYMYLKLGPRIEEGPRGLFLPKKIHWGIDFLLLLRGYRKKWRF